MTTIELLKKTSWIRLILMVEKEDYFQKVFEDKIRKLLGSIIES